MRIALLIVDPQRDFCDPSGALYVKGAEKDMDRLGLMLRRVGHKIDDITVTLDSHQEVDISHPVWWRDGNGKHPNPFTPISVDDMLTNRWTTTAPGAYGRTLAYLKAILARGRYGHLIWPEHCLIGTLGHTVQENLNDALHEWKSRFATVDYVTKGSNIWTEHFSAIEAEHPDPQDPHTQLNRPLIQKFETYDRILITGEARSHCLARTSRDIAEAFSDKSFVKKMVLLTDAMSDVADPPGTTLFTDLGKAFIRDMVSLGAQTATTTDVLT